MKSIKFIFALLFIAGAYASYGQAQFALGLKAGPNFAKIDANSSIYDNYSSRTGFHGGAFALVKLTKIGIQPEVIFSKQGSKYQFNNQDLESNFDYINIPIIIKLYLAAGLNLQAGPQFGFLSKGEVEQFVGGVKTTTDAKNFYKDSDVSLALGAGWDLPFGLTLDARYNLGLSKNNENSTFDQAKNQVYQISVGYKIIKFGK
jgi:hypothetical protein